MFASYTAAVLVLVSAVIAHKMEAGACPKYQSNLADESFNFTQFGGLWFEYLYDKDFKEDSPYECASWNLLHVEDGSYELLHNAVNRTVGKDLAMMNRQKMKCGDEKKQNIQNCTLIT